ncbi:MAG TPA: rhomboid family intramembrane serine protease [Chitinophagaceae bacterium]
MEFELNKVFYFFLIMSSGLVSSMAQLSFSTTGIGLSGIVYALFGYLFVKSKTSETYKDALDKRTTNLFLVWLVLCVILTRTGAWTVGNAAHIGGMLWGMLLAYASRYNRLVQLASGLIYLATLTALMIYGPFSTAYLSYKAYESHAAQKVEEAISIYKKILDRDPDSEFAKANLKQLEISQLQKEALDMHLQRKYREAEALYNKILSIDKDNEWTKENLKLLLIDEKENENPENKVICPVNPQHRLLTNIFGKETDISLRNTTLSPHAFYRSIN